MILTWPMRLSFFPTSFLTYLPFCLPNSKKEDLLTDERKENHPSTPPVLSESSHLLQRARLKLNQYSDQYRMSVFSNLNSSFFDSFTSAMEAPMSIGKVDITTNANRQLKKKDMANAAQS